MDRNLALEFVRVTEAGAIAAARYVGRGDKIAADQAAVDEMRNRFNQIDFNGTVVIGEGTKDEAPELYIGEKIGTGNGLSIDIAVDPLECTDSVAHGRYNALSVIVAGSPGSLLNAPDTYMNKLACGPNVKGKIELGMPTKEILEKTAKALDKDISEVTVVMLDRSRHEGLIQEIREAGSRVRLITDGDVAGGIAPCLPDSGIDLLMGIGASTEAVLAAAAIKIFGGEIFAQFSPQKPEHEQQLKKFGFSDLSKIYTSDDLAKGDQLTFTATGVIDGPLLDGVIFGDDYISTHSIVMRASSGTIRYISTDHKIKN